LSTSRVSFILLLLVAGTAMDGCRKQVPAKPAKQRVIPVSKAKTPAVEPRVDAVVAAIVNGVEIDENEVRSISDREQVSLEEALRLIVQAELVAQEAVLNRFPVDGEAGRMAIARKYLETVYSAETLCKNITPTQIRKFYELTYKPEWPVDVYKGRMLELRCCPRTDAACPNDEVKRCMDLHRSLLNELQQVRSSWVKGNLPDILPLKAKHPGLELTDFGFIMWPGIPFHEQKPKTLFDRHVVEQVMELEEGGVTSPIESSLGYHLMKLDNLRGAISPESPEFRKQAEKALCEARIEETRRNYVTELVKAALIKRNK